MPEARQAKGDYELREASSERTGHSRSPSRRRLVRRGSLAQRGAAHEIFEPRAGAHRRARAEAAAGQRQRLARRVREVVVRDELRGVGQVGDGCGVEDNFERLLAGHDARADAAAFDGALEQQLPVAQATPSCSLKPKMCSSRLRTRWRSRATSVRSAFTCASLPIHY